MPIQQPPVIRVRRAGKVRGRIEGLRPLLPDKEGFYYIALYPLKATEAQGDAPAASAWVGPEGVFEAKRILPGTYRVELQKYDEVGSISIDPDNLGRLMKHPKADAAPASQQNLGEVEVRGGELSKFRADLR